MGVKKSEWSDEWKPYVFHACTCVYSKHALEDQSEVEPGISSETTLIAEHERLAAEYHNERALLEEALRKSKDDSRHISDDELTEEVECAAVSADEEPLDKLQLRKTDPLKPIPTSKKKSNDDEVFTFRLSAVMRYIGTRKYTQVIFHKQ